MSSEAITKDDLKNILTSLYNPAVPASDIILAEDIPIVNINNAEFNVRDLFGNIYTGLFGDFRGTLYEASSSNTISSTSIDTYTVGATLSNLSAGTYFMVGQWIYNTRSSTGAVNTQVAIRNKTSSSLIAVQRLNEAAYNYCVLQCTCVVNITETTSFELLGSSTKTYTTATTNWLKAVKIA